MGLVSVLVGSGGEIIGALGMREDGRCSAQGEFRLPSWRTQECLGVLFGDVVLEDADGGGPCERSVGSVMIVEVDESFIGACALNV